MRICVTTRGVGSVLGALPELLRDKRRAYAPDAKP